MASMRVTLAQQMVWYISGASKDALQHAPEGVG